VVGIRPAPPLTGRGVGREVALVRAARTARGTPRALPANGFTLLREAYEATEEGLLLTRLGEIRREEGDTRDDFEVHVISYDAYTVDGVKRMGDRGVTDAIVGFRVPYINGPDTEPLETKIKHLEWYAENVIAKVNV
jgi:hypothetical protein